MPHPSPNKQEAISSLNLSNGKSLDDTRLAFLQFMCQPFSHLYQLLLFPKNIYLCGRHGCPLTVDDTVAKVSIEFAKSQCLLRLFFDACSNFLSWKWWHRIMLADSPNDMFWLTCQHFGKISGMSDQHVAKFCHSDHARWHDMLCQYNMSTDSFGHKNYKSLAENLAVLAYFGKCKL